MKNKIENSEVLEVTNKKVNHSFTHLLNHLFTSKKPAFTLAEMMIVIAIIGVVGALTLPTMISKIQQKNWDSASSVFEHKLNTALKVMNTQGTLSRHKSTQDFLDELGKNFKILKTCSNPMDCFENKVKWNEQKLDMTQVTNNKSFGMKSWPDSDAIGVQFASGVIGIISYNTDCEQNPYDNEIDVTSCISLVYDTQGETDPNENGKDVRTLNVHRLLNADCVAETNGVCVVKAMFTPSYLDCTDSANNKYCVGTQGNYGTTSSSWAGARKDCEESGGTLATLSQLTQIASDIYGISINERENKSGITFNSDKAKAYGITSGVYIYSLDEQSNPYVYRRLFDLNTSSVSVDVRYGGEKAICVD